MIIPEMLSRTTLPHIAMLEICREEFEAQNTTRGCLNRRGYINLGKKFMERTGREYTRKQFKNHWDSLKREYIWKTLKLNATGLGINALTGSIDATEAWFEEQNKAMTGAKKFTKAPLAHEDLMDIIFREGLCINEHAEVPRASRQHAHAGSDGSSDPEPEAVFEPTSLSRKRSGGAAGAT